MLMVLICTPAPDWFVSVGLRLWDNMEEIVEFSDLKLEEEEAADAETLKLIGRLSTLEEVRFLIVYFKLHLLLVVTIMRAH